MMKGLAVSFLLMASLGAVRAQAQSTPAGTSGLRFDAAAAFNVVHANAGPGQCGCFYMYGENGQFSINHHSGLSFLFDYGHSKATNVNGAQGRDISLSTYLDGVRYTMQRFGHLQPYGQALIGIGHTDTTYIIDQNSTKFAYMAGGGVNYQLGDSRFAIKIAEVNFLATKIPNAQNDRQNQIRMTTGIIFHFNRGR